MTETVREFFWTFFFNTHESIVDLKRQWLGSKRRL